MANPFKQHDDEKARPAHPPATPAQQPANEGAEPEAGPDTRTRRDLDKQGPPYRMGEHGPADELAEDPEKHVRGLPTGL